MEGWGGGGRVLFLDAGNLPNFEIHGFFFFETRMFGVRTASEHVLDLESHGLFMGPLQSSDGSARRRFS